jgi:hypothetical protein
MPCNGNIHRGVWAGHCFDITTRARHEQDVKEEWKDISGEIAREIASIWESEYGGDWCRIIMRRSVTLTSQKGPHNAAPLKCPSPRIYHPIAGNRSFKCLDHRLIQLIRITIGSSK